MLIKQIAGDIVKIRDLQKRMSFSTWQRFLPEIEKQLRGLDDQDYIAARQALSTLHNEKLLKNVVHFQLFLQNRGYQLIFSALQKHLLVDETKKNTDFVKNKKLLYLDELSWEQIGEELLLNSHEKFNFGQYREVDFYAEPQVLAPWLRDLLRQDRTIFLPALKAFPENELWDQVLGIKTIKPTDNYREDEVVTKRYERSGYLSYGPTSAKSCALIYDNFLFKKDDVILDIGSGEGTFVCYSALLPVKEIIGVEIRKELFVRHKTNLQTQQLVQPGTKISIYNDDIFQRKELLERVTVFYLANPLDQRKLKKLLGIIEESLKKHSRKIRIIYCCANHYRTIDKQKWLSRLGSNLRNGHIYCWETKNE